MKILIIGISYFHYAMSLVRSGELLGHEVKALWLSEFRDSESEYWKKRAVKWGVIYFEKDYLTKVNDSIVREILEYKPDVCIILNGKDIEERVLMLLKQQLAKIALFMSDSIQYDCYRSVLEKISRYDWVFSYEPTDITFVKNDCGYTHISYLPLGYDETIFCPHFNENKEYDLCFVGELNSKRLRILNKVAQYAQTKDKKLIIHTNPLYPQKYFWHGVRNYFRRKRLYKKYPYIMKYIVDQPVYDEKLAELYRKSRICINIHSDGLHNGANPRTFEILGCGSFEIVDQGHLSQVALEEGKHIIEFFDEDDLCEKIDDWFCHMAQAEEIALSGLHLVKERYTMKKCMEHIIEKLT